MSGETIKHIGIVIALGDNFIDVKVDSKSACSTCHAKGACTSLDVSEKIIHIETQNARSFPIGSPVNVILAQDKGMRAMLLGYVLPFITVLITLLTLSSLGFSELISGIWALSSLLPYYFGLYLARKFFHSYFNFTVEKLT